jgi:hypothetical protein
MFLYSENASAISLAHASIRIQFCAHRLQAERAFGIPTVARGLPKGSRVTVEWSAQSDLGNFQQSAELDCSGGYYHRHIVNELSPRSGEAETRSARGTPLGHQDMEYSYVDGHSYERSTGQLGFNAKPAWARSPSNFNPESYCQDLQAGRSRGRTIRSGRAIYSGGGLQAGSQ